VASRLFTLPAMSHDELVAHIRSHAPDYFPASVNIGEVEFDFHLLREEFKEGQESVQLMLAAGRKKAVREQLEMIEAAGLLPGAMDASSLSLLNSFVMHPALASGKPAAIVDVGHSLTKVMLVKDQLVSFVTEITMGGEAFTREIAQKLSLDPASAEQAKIALSQLDEITGEATVETKAGPVKAGDVHDACQPVMKQLAGELQKVRRFTMAEKNWQAVILTGGASRTRGLQAELIKELRCPAETHNTVEGIGLEPGLAPELPEFSLAIGLALKAVRPYVNRIDLIPRSDHERIANKAITAFTAKFSRAAWITAGAFVLLLLLAWQGSEMLGRRTEAQFKKISPEWQKSRQLRDINNELLRSREIINRLPAGREELDRALFELSRSAPLGLWFNAMEIKGKMRPEEEPAEEISTVLQCRLAGYAQSKEQVLELVKALEKSKDFTKPELKYLEKIGEKASDALPGSAGSYKFELVTELR
jgi:type IV pilus assembly protein PilM